MPSMPYLSFESFLLLKLLFLIVNMHYTNEANRVSKHMVFS